MRKNDYVIIMAGGIGSRFWPMSRSSFPKQFHDILGTGKTLIQMTYERFQGFIPAENIFIVTNQRYLGLVKDQLKGIEDEQILLEPVGRNTAPCIAYASYKIFNRNPEAGIMVAASDHLILNVNSFLEDIALGLDQVQKEEVIMTLGIRPTRPDTGYGYIQYLEREEGVPQSFYEVKTFTEKPELDMAKTFLASGDFLWNSGMFIFSAQTIRKAFRLFLPEMADLFESINESYDTDGEAEAIGSVYSQCKNESIDFGIMEKADNVFVIPSSFDWSDLGTWVSLYEHMDKDYLGNAVQGKVVVYESTNNVVRIRNHEKLVVLDGLEDFIVVDTDDVLLVCRKDNEQVIKSMVSDMREAFRDKYV